MPLVPAAGYPTGPEAPQPISPVVPRGLGPRQEINVTPQAFGEQVGQQLLQAGERGEKGAGELATAAFLQQNQHNEIAAHAAFNSTQDTSTDLLYGSPDNPGYFTLRGDNARNAYPATRDKLVKLYADARNSLQNPAQQLTFDNEARRNLNFQLARMGDHYDREQQAAAKATNDASYELNRNGLNTTGIDTPEEQLRIKGMMDAEIRKLRDAGQLNDNNVNNSLAKVRADVTKADAQRLGVHDAVAAAQYVEQNKDVLGDYYPQLAHEFRERASEQVARGAANKGVGGGIGGVLGPPPSGPVKPEQFTQEANKQGVDPKLVHATASIESSYGTNTDNNVSPSNTGIFQRAKANEPGGMNDSYENQIRLGVGDLVRERNDLRDKLGREPTNAEVYLAHQQGPGGAAWLLTHPNERAGNVPGGPNEAPGDVRIRNNGGNPDAPASQFVAHWAQVYAQHEGRFKNIPSGGTQVAAAAPTAVTDAGPGVPITAPAGSTVGAAIAAPGPAIDPQAIGIVRAALPGTQEAPFAPQTIELLKKTGMTDPQIDQLRQAGLTDAQIAELDRKGQLPGQPNAPAPSKVTAPTPAAATAPRIPPPAPPAPEPKTLEQVEADTRAHAAADAAAAGFDPDLTQKTIDLALSKAHTQYNLSAAVARQTEQNNNTVARAQVIAGNNGEPFHDLDAYLADPDRRRLYDSLKPEDQKSLRNWITDYATKHIPVTPDRLARYDELNGMAIDSPDKFMAIDILKEDLPINMQKQLLAKRNNIVKGIMAPPDTIKAMATLDRMGILENTGISKTDNPPLYHQFVSALDDAIRNFKLEKKKPVLDTEDIRGIGMDLLKVAIPGWFHDTRQFETIVPNADRDDIVKAYQGQYGRNPTPRQILQIYHTKLERNAETATAPLPAAEAPEPQF